MPQFGVSQVGVWNILQLPVGRLKIQLTFPEPLGVEARAFVVNLVWAKSLAADNAHGAGWELQAFVVAVVYTAPIAAVDV